ncbi:hypothetical protein D7Z26_18510 [Cohnella endophytica]|uniref:Uncharacterized protein n=1 Tax=Cohnella endophytica TaxID=2419778 RepID=A0A494XHY3_9BACL|nr:hypothetical protein D7Z26_18510 [Cohnella endophytica]
MISKGSHPAIIDVDLWNVAQSKLELRKLKR